MKKPHINQIDQAVNNYKYFDNPDDFKKVYSLLSGNSKFINAGFIITGIIAVLCWLIIFVLIVIAMFQSIIQNAETIWNTYPTQTWSIVLTGMLFSLVAYFAYSHVENKILESKKIYLPNVRDKDILSLDDDIIDKYFTYEISVDELKEYKEIAKISKSFSSLLSQIMNNRNGKILWIDYVVLGGIGFINAGKIEKNKTIKMHEANKIKTEIKGLIK